MKKKQEKLRIFYDGTCEACHRFVRFTLSRMTPQTLLYFSPLEGVTFKRIEKNFPKHTFPDSIVVYDETGEKLLFKSEAVVKVLSVLTQPWRSIGFILSKIPLFISNRAYDLVAKIRRKLFKTPKQSCPTFPQKWKRHFED